MFIPPEEKGNPCGITIIFAFSKGYHTTLNVLIEAA